MGGRATERQEQAWEIVVGQSEQIKEWLDQGLTVTKVHIRLGRRGVVVSYRTLHRYATTEMGSGRRRTTVRVADCDPVPRCGRLAHVRQVREFTQLGRVSGGALGVGRVHRRSAVGDEHALQPAGT